MVTDTLPEVSLFTSSTGIRIYRIPMIVFPNGFTAYSYVILGAGVPTLVDTGSGYGRSTDDLLNGIRDIHDKHGEQLTIGDIQRVIISHGHVDHFGGLGFVIDQMPDAQVGIHPLDRRVLANYEERVAVATNDLKIYLRRAGTSESHLPEMLNMYGFSKKHVQTVPVHFTIEDGEEIDGMQFIHVPGHCSGQLAIRIDDVLLSADHILPVTSPHLAPESITHYTGVGHYRDSLRKVRELNGIRLTLGGHEHPFTNLQERIQHIERRIDEKIEQILDIMREHGKPMTIKEISIARYSTRQGFDVLLAIQEAGAYVEYLYDRGYLGIANLNQIVSEETTAIQYVVI